MLYKISTKDDKPILEINFEYEGKSLLETLIVLKVSFNILSGFADHIKNVQGLPGNILFQKFLQIISHYPIYEKDIKNKKQICDMFEEFYKIEYVINADDLFCN